MKNILGLGSAGSNIAGFFSKYKEYNVYQIAPSVEKRTKFVFKLEKFDNPEDYETMDTEKIDKFLSKIENQISVFLCGASISSGLTLKVLEPLSKRGVEIEIIYIVPETEVLGEKKVKQERLVRNILQEYSRSAVFKRVLLVSNLALESLSGGTTVVDYYKQINEILITPYYMLDLYKNTAPISSTISGVAEDCRILTMAVVDPESSQDKLLYNLEDVKEIIYYFGMNEEKLKKEKNLFRNITNRVKSRITENTKVSFAIYPTKYEEDYVYAEYFSSEIQKNT